MYDFIKKDLGPDNDPCPGCLIAMLALVSLAFLLAIGLLALPV